MILTFLGRFCFLVVPHAVPGDSWVQGAEPTDGTKKKIGSFAIPLLTFTPNRSRNQKTTRGLTRRHNQGGKALQAAESPIHIAYQAWE